jgi:hypothetical protein
LTVIRELMGGMMAAVAFLEVTASPDMMSQI